VWPACDVETTGSSFSPGPSPTRMAIPLQGGMGRPVQFCRGVAVKAVERHTSHLQYELGYG
jgi:hypothetical protein